MIQAEKNMKRRSSYLPISIGWISKIAFAVAGFALWGWSFVAVVVGLGVAVAVAKTLLSCLVSLVVLCLIVWLVVVIIF